MKIFTVLPALFLAVSLFSSVGEACQDKACQAKCEASGKSCSEQGCGDGKSCKMSAKKSCDISKCEDCKKNGCTPDNCKCEGAAGGKCAGCADKTSSSTTTESVDYAAAATKTAGETGGQAYQLNIKGMTCGSCAKKIKEKLEALNGLEKNSLQIDIEGKKAFVVIRKGTKDAATVAALKKQVDEKLATTGYTVTSIQTIQ